MNCENKNLSDRSVYYLQILSMRMMPEQAEASNMNPLHGKRMQTVFNFKQKELSHMLFDRLKEKFPEIRLTGITPGAEDPEDIWVNIIYPEDEDREIALRELAGEISSDILLDYGYSVSIVSGEDTEIAETI